MAEIIQFPINSDWHRIEEFIKDQYVSTLTKNDLDYVLARFKDIFDTLPEKKAEVKVDLTPLAHLLPNDLAQAESIMRAALEDLLRRAQRFGGAALGEILLLVVEISQLREGPHQKQP